MTSKLQGVLPIFLASLLVLQIESRAQQVISPEVESAATLRIKSVYAGKPISLGVINGSKDPFCASCIIPNNRLLVGPNGELENVVLIWDEKKNSQLPRRFAEPEVGCIEIEHRCCMLHPHIAVARVGQEITLRNRDNTAHSAHFAFLHNLQSGMAIPIGEPQVQKLAESEPIPVLVQCNIHPCERAYLIVKDHPFVGISRSTGFIEIPNLPVGSNWFRLWHESLSSPIEYVKLNGVKSPVTKGLIQLNLEPGVNDLGIIQLDEDQFRLQGEGR